MNDYVYTDYEYEDDNIEYAEYYTDEDYATLQKESWEAETSDLNEEPLMSLWQLFQYCVIPTLSSSSLHVNGILLFPLIFLAFSRIGPITSKLPAVIIHLISLGLGIAFTWIVFKGFSLWFAGLCVAVLFVLILTHFTIGKCRGPVCLAAGLLYFLASELYFVDPPIWHAIRGIQMVAMMKLVSLGFDLDSKAIKNLPNPIEILGYALHPGTVIFGPWISFSSYRTSMSPMHWSWKWIGNICLNLILSFGCLLFSTCFINWLLGHYTNRYIVAYRDALSFRASHYFISYLSQMASSFSGLDVGRVCNPLKIEFPRSLVDVVVNWNIPMHNWLKKYVFNAFYKRLGIFLTILVTYLTSAVFHGLNFQLGAVLLSLGFYTYTEHSLRLKLSEIFDACIQAKCCKPTCKHKHKDYSAITVLINLLFTSLSVFHLAYLGMMFDNSQIQEDGYNMAHTLKKWGSFTYSSHWVAFICYVINSVL